MSARIVIKLVLGLVVLGGAFAGGYYSRKPETRVETKTNTVTEQVDRVITKVVTVKETAPDRTVKETVTTETTQDKTVKQVEKAQDKGAAPLSNKVQTLRNTYSLGLKWQPDWRDRTWVPSQAEAGYRVLGDLWVTGGFDWKNHGLLVGVRYDF